MSQNFLEDTSLSYDDIQLVPQYSEVMSRSDVSLETDFTRNFKLLTPFVASPMHTICDNVMARKMMSLGGVGIIHRFSSIEDQCLHVKLTSMYVDDPDVVVKWPSTYNIPVAAAIGVGDDELNRALFLIESGANVLLIDVAHGHHKKVKDMIEALRSSFGTDIDIIAGNVATLYGAAHLSNWGADAIRVGVGGGSLCTTRLETGFGVPNVTSIIHACEGSTVPVIADGGIRRGGDAAKALALGASSVMLGSLLSGTNETPGPVLETRAGLFKRYQGSASIETKTHANKDIKHIEGVSTTVPYKGGVKYVIQSLEDGLRSALSYSGSSNLNTYHNKATITRITNAGIVEANPHLIS